MYGTNFSFWIFLSSSALCTTGLQDFTLYEVTESMAKC